MIKTKTFKENLETLYNSLEQKQREPGLGYYYCLKEDLENKEEIERFIQLLHNDESPNDWRYDIIHSLLDSLLNNYDVNNEDEAYEHINIISDSLVNVYNYGLAKWLCDDVSRGYFDSSSEISSIYEVNHSESIYGVIMKRQYEEIYTMASKIVDYCS